MTFKQFEYILLENRKDIERAEKRGRKVFIYFKDNKKPYGYTGAYKTVLYKLDVNFNCPNREKWIKESLAYELDKYLEEDLFYYFDPDWQEDDPVPLIHNEEDIKELLDRLDLVRTYPFYDVYI